MQPGIGRLRIELRGPRQTIDRSRELSAAHLNQPQVVPCICRVWLQPGSLLTSRLRLVNPATTEQYYAEIRMELSNLRRELCSPTRVTRGGIKAVLFQICQCQIAIRLGTRRIVGERLAAELFRLLPLLPLEG